MGDSEVSREFTVLDGCSMILGASIAAVHVRVSHPEPHSLAGWLLLFGLLGLISLTASGPFLYLSRRFLARRVSGYPQVGDRLWVLWGTPWVISALVEAVLPSKAINPGRPDPVYVGSLGLGLFLATMVAVPIFGSLYLWGDPGATRRSAGIAWSQTVGLALTATWPIQCGVGLVLMG